MAALIMWRAGETVVLERRDVDVWAVTLLVRRGKGGRGRTVPRHQDLASLFGNWPSTGRLMARAHSLRHSAACHWLTATAGIPPNVVSQWLGHANPEVTLRTYRAIVASTHSMADVP